MMLKTSLFFSSFFLLSFTNISSRQVENYGTIERKERRADMAEAAANLRTPAAAAAAAATATACVPHATLTTQWDRSVLLIHRGT